jgi:hypothetical protein
MHSKLTVRCLAASQSAGDHGVIAKETARQLGLGTNIPDAAGLPTLGADGKIPNDLGKKYGKMILEADGFAQVRLGLVALSCSAVFCLSSGAARREKLWWLLHQLPRVLWLLLRVLPLFPGASPPQTVQFLL